MNDSLSTNLLTGLLLTIVSLLQNAMFILLLIDFREGLWTFVLVYCIQQLLGRVALVA